MKIMRLLLIIAVIFSLSLVATAQDEPAAEGEEEVTPIAVTITGVVEEIGEGVVIVDGVPYWFSAEIDISVFVVGESITVTVVLSDDVTMTIIETGEAEDGEVVEEEVAEHPVAAAIAEGVGVPYEEVWGWAENDLGFGEIARAYLLANEAEVDVQEIFIMRIDMGMGWGNILKEYDVSPSALAPGALISGRLVLVDPEDLPEDVEADGSLTSEWSPDDVDYSEYEPDVVDEIVNGDGDGTNKFGCEGRGNSCNAPGQNKDKGDKGKGK